MPLSEFKGKTAQGLIDTFANFGLSDEIMQQSAGKLREAGYSRIGNVLITNEGLKAAPKQLAEPKATQKTPASDLSFSAEQLQYDKQLLREQIKQEETVRLARRYSKLPEQLSTSEPSPDEKPQLRIRPRKNLSPREEAIQVRTARHLRENLDSLVARYNELNPKVVNADLAKELFEEYVDDPTANDRGVQAASALSQYIFRTRLAELPRGYKIQLTAGGQASGKTQTVSPDADLVYDSTMSNVTGNREVIDAIKRSGHKAAIVFIHRPADEAAVSMLDRALSEGRMVSEDSLVKGHFGSQQAFIDDTDAYARENDIPVRYLRNVTGQGYEPMTLEDLKRERYTDEREVRRAVHLRLNEADAKGTYPKRIIEAAREKDPGLGSRGDRQRNVSRQPETQGTGQDTSTAAEASSLIGFSDELTQEVVQPRNTVREESAAAQDAEPAQPKPTTSEARIETSHL